MFKVREGVRGVSHFQSYGRGVSHVQGDGKGGALAMFKPMGEVRGVSHNQGDDKGGDGRQPCSR